MEKVSEEIIENALKRVSNEGACLEPREELNSDLYRMIRK